MDSWNNGAKASDVKRIIDNNFDILDKRTINVQTYIESKFVASKWTFDSNLETYTISIPYSDYNKKNPWVMLYIKNGNGYSPVYGGYIVHEDSIELQSDIPYEGRVVIR